MKKVVLVSCIALALIGLTLSTVVVAKTILGSAKTSEESQMLAWIKAHEGEPESVKDFKVISKKNGCYHFGFWFEDDEKGNRQLGLEKEARIVRIEVTWRAKTPFGGWAVKNHKFDFKDGKIEN
jgi:hypothetical protein